MRFASAGLILTFCYCLIAVIALGSAAYGLYFNPGNSELVGVPLIMLGTPWSFMPPFSRDWGSTGANLFSSAICMGLNAAVIYLVGWLTVRVVTRVAGKPSQPDQRH